MWQQQHDVWGWCDSIGSMPMQCQAALEYARQKTLFSGLKMTIPAGHTKQLHTA
jgi:hypothetical protein